MSASDGSRAAGPIETPVMGRPRDVNRDVAILDAALLLLTEVGYDQLSMESIASRAGVAKTTIYRRYSDKAALVAAAVEYRSSSTPPEPGPGGLVGAENAIRRS